MVQDLTPKRITIIPAKERIRVPDMETQMAQQVGGWVMSSNELSKGKVRLQADQERILIGDVISPTEGIGIYLGRFGAGYDFRIGDPDNNYFYYKSSDGSVNLVGSISGRSTGIIAAAINDIGNFIDATLNTQTKQILGDFTFGESGAIKMITDENNGLWLSPTGILGKKAGNTTFAIDTGGNATFAGNLVAATGTLGAITVSAAGHIRGGQTAYNTGVGFWLGYHSGAYKFSLGNPDGDYIYWDGTGLYMKGELTLEPGTKIPWSDVTDDGHRPEDDATVGAIWGTNLIDIPGTLGTPAGTGLFLSATHLGYFDSPNWKTYMDNSGNFYLGGTSGKLQWVAATNTLSIAGDVEITGGDAYNKVEANLPSDTNLIGYWSFDEGKDLVANDSSGNGYTGTLTGSMTDADWVAGVVGTALDLDGSDDHIVASPTYVNATEWSLSVWAYKDSYIEYQSLYSDFTSADRNILCGYESVENRMTFYASTGSTTYSTFIAGVWLAGEWAHWAFVFKGGQYIRIYKNAVMVKERTDGVPASIAAVHNPRYFGRYSSYYFDGKIDEPRMYLKALTDAEIYALYKNPAGNKGVMVPTGRLTSGTIYSKQITLAVADGTGDSFIAAGKTDFDNTQSGFILGIDDSDANKAKFYIGNATNYLNWDGSALTIKGTLSAATGTLGSITAGTFTGITIAIGTGNNIFKADANGIYLGNATFGSAPFRVNMAGALVATSATITGTVTITSGSGIANLSDAGALATKSVIGASDCNTTIISGGKIITGLLTASNIQTGTLNASFVTVTNLNATNITTGTLTGITVQTASSGARVVMGGGTEWVKFYDATLLCGTLYGSGGSLLIVAGQADKNVTIAGGSTSGNAALAGYGAVKLTTTSTGVSISGNIAVTGTVDGIDISTHAATASAHHSSTSSGIAITPSSVDTPSIYKDGTQIFSLVTTSARCLKPFGFQVRSGTPGIAGNFKGYMYFDNNQEDLVFSNGVNWYKVTATQI